MKVDTVVMIPDLRTVPDEARGLEALGYDGIMAAETKHDPFLPLALIAEHTERVEIGTAIAVAFPRSPMHLANVGHDLQRFSRGRMILGLGSQIKPHIEKRFSAVWSHPAARMRELVLATRAIWRTWEEGEPLKFEGEFYRHTLMTPFFDPGPTGHGLPKVFIAAVGERMTEAAGEVCDGMFVHAFTTEQYLREKTLPAIERGLAKAGRTRSDIELSLPVFMISGNSDEEIARADAAVRQQIAFYGSTPAYRPVLELGGWGELQDELNALSKKGEWEEMGRRIPGDVVDAFAVQGKPEELPGLIGARFAGLADRISFYAPYKTDPERWVPVIQGLQALSSTPD